MPCRYEMRGPSAFVEVAKTKCFVPALRPKVFKKRGISAKMLAC